MTTTARALGKRSLARATPVSAEELDRLAELHGAGLSCRQIAREMSRAPVTISRHAADLGLSFDRSQVKAATAARVADLAALRAEVSAEFLSLAQLINQRVRAALTATGDDEVKPWGLRDYAYAAGAYYDRHLAQAVMDARPDAGNSAVDDWLAAMTGETPPPSQSEHDEQRKVVSVLGGLAKEMFSRYGDGADAGPGE